MRNEVKNNTEIGIQIKNIISKGDFATDEIVNRLIKKIIFDPQKKNKLIFDGYPRSLSQALNLKQLFILSIMILIINSNHFWVKILMTPNLEAS